VSIFHIYKRGQGRYARTITLVAVILIGLIGAAALSGKLQGTVGPALQFGIPAIAAVLLGVVMVWVVNRAKSADFLIATEGEMKKVSWSSKKEIVGSTKVVIVAVFIMSVILYTVDFLFAVFFEFIGVHGG
jgi:preprotein translocase subunit SecE